MHPSNKRLLSNIGMFLLLSLPALILYRPHFENDTFWLLNTGKYILAHGIPHTEPFTIHSGFHFVAQQWLTALTFYGIFRSFGAIGLYVMNWFLYASIVFVVFQIANRIGNDRRLISGYIAAFVCVFLSFQMVLRPQIFSLLLIAVEIYFLESYICFQGNKIRYLTILPFLSILLINFHSALWPVFFLLYVPYLLDGFGFRIRKIHGQGYPKLPIFGAFALSVIGGFANPYGFENMLYLFRSYGNPLINRTISEMASPDFKGALGISIFGLGLTILLLYALISGSTRLRYVLITLGTLYMSLSSVRSFPFFVIFGCAFLAYYLKDLDISKVMPMRRRAVLITLGLLAMFTGRIALGETSNETGVTFQPQGAVEFIRRSVAPGSMRLFNEYHTGGFLEFNGIKTFIDSRAEVFTKRLNGMADVFEDYARVIYGRMNYLDLAEKYRISHFLITRGELLDNYLMHDSKYVALYKDKDFIVYGPR